MQYIIIICILFLGYLSGAVGYTIHLDNVCNDYKQWDNVKVPHTSQCWIDS